MIAAANKEFRTDFARRTHFFLIGPLAFLNFWEWRRAAIEVASHRRADYRKAQTNVRDAFRADAISEKAGEKIAEVDLSACDQYRYNEGFA